MNEQAELALRTLALNYLLGYVPCDYGTPQWTQVIGRIYASDSARQSRQSQDGWKCGTSGTTCGYLAAWLLWAMGCRDSKTVNREDDEWNSKHPESRPLQKGAPTSEIWFEVGKGMAKITSSKNASGAWVDKTGAYTKWSKRGDTYPKRGDIVHVSDPAINGSDHVLIFLGEYYDDQANLIWLSADGGQASLSKRCKDSKGKETVIPYITQKFNARVMYEKSGKLYFPSLSAAGTKKTLYVNGWLSLARLPVWTWAGAPKISTEVKNGVAVPTLPPTSKYWDPKVWPYLQQCILDVYGQWGWKYQQGSAWVDAWNTVYAETTPAVWNAVMNAYSAGLYGSVLGASSPVAGAHPDGLNVQTLANALTSRIEKGDSQGSALFDGLNPAAFKAFYEATNAQARPAADTRLLRISLPTPDVSLEPEVLGDEADEERPQISLQGLFRDSNEP